MWHAGLIVILLTYTHHAGAFPTSSLSGPYLGTTLWNVMRGTEYLVSEVRILSFCDYTGDGVEVVKIYPNTTQYWTETQCIACTQYGFPCPARVVPGSPLKEYSIKRCGYGGPAARAVGGNTPAVLQQPEMNLVYSLLHEAPLTSVGYYPTFNCQYEPCPSEQGCGVSQQPFWGGSGLAETPYDSGVFAQGGYTDVVSTAQGPARRWCDSQPVNGKWTVSRNPGHYMLDATQVNTLFTCENGFDVDVPRAAWAGMYASNTWVNSEVLRTYSFDRSQTDCDFSDPSTGWFGTTLWGGLVTDSAEWQTSDPKCPVQSCSASAVPQGYGEVATWVAPFNMIGNGMTATTYPAVCGVTSNASQPTSLTYGGALTGALCLDNSVAEQPIIGSAQRPYLFEALSRVWTPHGGLPAGSPCPSSTLQLWGPVAAGSSEACEQAIARFDSQRQNSCWTLGVIQRSNPPTALFAHYNETLGPERIRCVDAWTMDHYNNCVTAEVCSELTGCVNGSLVTPQVVGCAMVQCGGLEADACRTQSGCFWNATA